MKLFLVKKRKKIEMSAFVLKTWQIFFAFFSLALAFRTYYDILGVSKTAKEHEIKRAFRRLALKLHPDRNKESNAEAKFREIAEGLKQILPTIIKFYITYSKQSMVLTCSQPKSC